ncbi:MAG: cyclic pyranopterin monophosphate synthase MoaC [Chloroflexi bacterium]|nr:cyclic pyranopterin monophosphate synthase MoaC [Chloroflexota bacterium]
MTGNSPRLTHLDERGRAHMVDVGTKPDTDREAVARGTVVMQPSTLDLVREGGIAKGDVVAIAQVAAVMAAKSTAGLIPLCHPLLLTGVDVKFELNQDDRIGIEVTVRTYGKTGAEMEALTAVSVAALTIYDMCKGVDRALTIEKVQLVRKSGGRTGNWQALDE